MPRGIPVDYDAIRARSKAGENVKDIAANMGIDVSSVYGFLNGSRGPGRKKPKHKNAKHKTNGHLNGNGNGNGAGFHKFVPAEAATWEIKKGSLSVLCRTAEQLREAVEILNQ